jgi:hypothetical protein
MTYKSLPIARDIDGRSYEQQMADFNRKYGVEETEIIECHYEVWDGQRWQETGQGERFMDVYMETVRR